MPAWLTNLIAKVQEGAAFYASLVKAATSIRAVFETLAPEAKEKLLKLADDSAAIAQGFREDPDMSGNDLIGVFQKIADIIRANVK
jgi:hypothetical protein